MIFFSFPDKFSRILFDFRAYLFIKGRSRNGDIKVNMKYNKDLKTLSTDSSLLFGHNRLRDYKASYIRNSFIEEDIRFDICHSIKYGALFERNRIVSC